MSWLVALPGRIWGYIVGCVAIGMMVIAAWAKAKQSGVDAQVAAEGQRDREAANVRIREEIGAARIADPAAELRNKWGR
jgi:hypothetical protein